MTDPLHPMATSPAVPASTASEAAGHPAPVTDSVPVTDPAPVTASATEADTAPAADPTTAAEVISSGRALLGIELGSTRIKAVLIDRSHAVVASGSHEWANDLVDGVWTYAIDDVVAGLRAALDEPAAGISVVEARVRRDQRRATALALGGVVEE